MKSKSRDSFAALVKYFLSAILCFLSGYLNFVDAEQYADTVWVPVTFYDFHPDGRSDFQRCNGSGLQTGMVQNFLDSLRKPIPTPIAATPQNCAYNLPFWFRPSGVNSSDVVTFGPNKNTPSNELPAWRWEGLVPSVQYSTAADTFWVGPHWNANDNNVNLVYYDYLPFVLTNPTTGMYSFDRTKRTTSFFWLDNMGFGNEPAGNRYNHNYGFTMEIHHEFTYQGDEEFDFSGDDDVWVFINGKLAIDLGGIHGEVPGSFNLRNNAEEYGLEIGKKYMLDVFYAERKMIESNCLIQTNLVRNTLQDLVITAEADSIVAGDTITITGAVYNQNKIPMEALSDSIKWFFVEDQVLDTNDRLLDLVGKTSRFTATKAYRDVKIAAKVTDPDNPQVTKYDTVTIKIVAGPPHHIVIEASATPEKWGRHDLLQATITSKETTWDKLYAVVRDRFENLSSVIFTSPTTTVWTSFATTIATVDGVDQKKYQGVITRVTSGDTKVSVSDGNLIPDTVDVTVADYTIDSLRLRNIRTGEIVDTLRLETDSTGDYRVEGLKSTYLTNPNDPNAWDTKISVNWALRDTLKSAINPPDLGNTWTYDPTNHGTGRVVLTYTGSNTTVIKNVPAIITLSDPSKIEIEIVSLTFERYAGNPIRAEVRIYNTDGLYPIDYCYGGTNSNDTNKVIYSNNLGNGGANRPNPTVEVDGVTTRLNFDTYGFSSNQCFSAGRDTIKLLLYYAPFEATIDSFHTIAVSVGKISNKTDRFKLNPGPLDSLIFEDLRYIPTPVPQPLEPNEGFFGTYVTGYDEFGNRIGHYDSNWSITGTLDSIKLANSFGNNNSYITVNEKSEMSGLIVAEATGKGDKNVRATMPLSVLPPTSKIDSALTQDRNGNGLLDRIIITFNQKTKFVFGGGDVTVSFNGILLQAGSIELASPDSTTYYINLVESDATRPQTSWTPTVELSNFEGITNPTRVVAKDGAPPVVWKVIKEMDDLNRQNDLVQIILSERANRSKDSLVSLSSKPSDVFNVWIKSNEQYSIVNKFDGIDNFWNIVQDSIFVVKMTNGADLTGANYVNINEISRLIADQRLNYPDSLNHKVPVVVRGNTIRVEIVPSPARSTTTHGIPGKIEFVNENEKMLIDRVNTYGGAIIRISLLTPPANVKLKVFIKVYDVVGNQVIWASVEDLIQKLKEDQIRTGVIFDPNASMTTLNYYWNCTNSKGMKIAPGQYRAIVFFDYSHPDFKNERVPLNIGIRK